MTKKKILALTMALMLAVTLPLAVLAEVYDLAQGSITVEAREDGQYVSQEGVADNVKQTTETVIKQTDSDTTSTTNTITIKAEKDQTAEVTISDVNIDVSKEGTAAISAEGDGNVTIELDGDNTAKSGTRHAGVEKNNDGNLTITDADTDGALEAVGGGNGAGIGGGSRQSVSDITIDGGDITATGEGDAAGIGGGAYADASDITINDGNIKAIGGSMIAHSGGAGIGGGSEGNGSDITINGGNIEAIGGSCSAGIGGGGSNQINGGNGTNITITDGNVIAKGGMYGAGIGGASVDGIASNIKISGGKVEAVGGLEAAGIGGGWNGRYGSDGFDIVISGDAQVKVSGGEKGAGIGDGHYYDSDSRSWFYGSEITPNTDGLTTGSIAYYAPDADMGKDNPEKLLHKTADGTMETHTGVTLKSSTEATCLKNATVTYQCSCGAEITTELLGTALGHELGDYVSDKNATCTADGTKTAKCTHTGCTYSETLPDAGTALGHKLGDYISDNNATCTADGTKTAKCIRYGEGGCQESKSVTDVGSKLEHKFDPYVPDNNATCTENGTETAKCAYGCGAEDTRVIPESKLPHEFGAYVYQDDATCTADGTEIAQCKHCDATDTRTAEGTMLEHSFTHYVSNNDATYDSDGTKTAECDYGCGATDTTPDEGSKLTLYRVTDEAGKSVVYKSNYSGSTLTITAEYDYATLTGTVAALRHLQGKRIETIVFITNGATSTFHLADITEAGVYALTHNAENVAFLLNGEDIGSILK